MGVVIRENILYLRVSCGKMKNKNRGIEANGYMGTFLGIREKKGEYEGKPTCQIEMKMESTDEDGEKELAIIQFTKESWYALGFFARIKKIDLTKQFMVGVMPSDKNEKMSFCYLKQEGIDKVEADKSFPKYEIVTVGDKKIQDWTKPFAAMDEIMKYMNDSIKPTEQKEGSPTAEGTQDDVPF